MDDNCTLRVEGIKKIFPGTIALAGVDLEIVRGEVHALVGENGAGKSTLMNIISGVCPPDAGKVFFKGREVHFRSPLEAQNAGIGFVHQELALCPHLSVSHNIFLGRLPERLGIVDGKLLNQRAREALSPFNVGILPESRVGDLSVANQQIIEIARALSLDCGLVIFDEPTSSLNEAEAETLFGIIRAIRARGISVLYISHKLSEIFELCDRVTVLRDGRRIGTHEVRGAAPEQIVAEMAGRELGSLYPVKSKASGETLLTVSRFTRFPRFKDVSFELRKGEILGLSGLVGAGRSEVVRAVCGIDRAQSGRVLFGGEEAKIRSYADALDRGLCYLTEDRKFDGLFLKMSISRNLIPILLDRSMSSPLLPERRIKELAREYKERLSIKFSSSEQSVDSLSGGNQQKVLLAKLLAMGPKIMILDEPTRGIDVGAKSEIHALLRELCEAGIGIIVLSSEMPEIVGLCDRVVVMHEGEVVAELEGEDVNQRAIIAAISRKREVA